ncbi:hypothetical protein M0P25_03395 [archaeon]|nr:hypothetical protein [archaeon]
MDLLLTFKKYIENYKIILSLSALFIFLLFLINPVFSLFGGTINLTYNILNFELGNIIISILASLILLFIFSLVQTIIIYKISKDYSVNETIYFKEIKKIFYKLLKFNWIFFLVIFGVSVVLYDLNILNNIFTQIIFFIITIALWFVPQIIVLENREIPLAIWYSARFWKNNFGHLLTLFLCGFILILITSLLDVLIAGSTGIIISVLFLVLFVIPFTEILKTEIYLNKYKLLKPRHQFKLKR